MPKFLVSASKKRSYWAFSPIGPIFPLAEKLRVGEKSLILISSTMRSRDIPVTRTLASADPSIGNLRSYASSALPIWLVLSLADRSKEGPSGLPSFSNRPLPSSWTNSDVAASSIFSTRKSLSDPRSIPSARAGPENNNSPPNA